MQLSLGRNADGKYDIKRETIRGKKQDAITATNHQTVQQAYEEWIEFIREYQTPNTHRFYRERSDG